MSSSESDSEYRVGNKRPPLHTRFGPGNKAARGRRRKGARRVRLLDGLQDGLAQEVSLQSKGKTKKVPLGYAVGQALAQNFAKAQLSEQLKVVDRMNKLCMFELDDQAAQLDDLRQELEDDRRDLHRREQQLRKFREATFGINEYWQVALRNAFDLLTAVKKACHCGACEGEFRQAYHELQEVVPSVFEAREITDKWVAEAEVSEAEDGGGGSNISACTDPAAEPDEPETD